VALFSARSSTNEYEPVVAGGEPGTLPHQLDRDVIPALPALWYFLHLPMTFWDLIDLSGSALALLSRRRSEHAILLAPIQAFDTKIIPPLPTSLWPSLVVAPDELLGDARSVSSELDCVLSPLPTSALSDDTLAQNWAELHRRLIPTLPYVAGAPLLVRRLDTGPLVLPIRRLARQLSQSLDFLPATDEDPLSWVRAGLTQHAFVQAIASLEDRQASQAEADESLGQLVEQELQITRLPIALGAPGVASPYERALRADAGMAASVRRFPRFDAEDIFVTDFAGRADDLVERSAIEFLVAHSAAGDGLGMVVESLPPGLFSALATLEHHWRSGPVPRKVWRLLSELDRLAAPIWNESVTEAVARASRLTVLSNFPLGILRFPGDTAPLACRVPIAYHPLSPLTRALQIELQPRVADLSRGFHVLVAECIPPEDPVGQLSRIGWDVGQQIFESEAAHNSTLTRVNVRSVSQLSAEIRNAAADVLVLSAHGFAVGGVAGVVIGDERCLGPEFGEVPPVLVLSACHVAPRGRGEVTVTDLLLRQGALAVLGTHVPVDVRHNAMLTVRLFVYMTESVAGVEDHETLLDAWRRTQSTHAVIDILHGNRQFAEWGGSMTPSGLPVLTEFMTARSQDRLRVTHVYDDSEEVLLEIADQMGDGERVRQWLKTPGYLPESAFYELIGCPERVVLRDPDRAARQAPLAGK
jgi:hypothetical protein